MQITLVSSGDTFSDVLNRFEKNFSLNWVEIEEKFSRWMVSISESLIKTYSIRELKAMTDFLATAFNVADLDAPKRNSKVSLADWIARVLFDAHEAAETSEAITVQATEDRSPDKNYWCPQCDEWMDRSGFDEVLGSDFQEQLCKTCGSEVCHEFDQDSPAIQVADSPNPKIEVLEPEEKPVYQISIHSDRHVGKKGWGFTERVSALPPYLLDREGNLFEKSSYTIPSCDATYAQIAFNHLSNIAEEHGQLIELTTDDLVAYRVNVHGNPPPYIVHKRGVYKRMTWGVISLGSTVKYAQVVSEYLPNIVVV